MATPILNLIKIVSISRNRQLNAYGSLLDLSNWFDYHQQLIIENWYYYYGLHRLFMKRFDMEDDRQFLQRVQDATVENHVQPLIDVIVANLYSYDKPVKRYVCREGVVDEKLTTWFQENVWNHNNQQELDDKKALNALVAGYCLIKREMYDIRTGKVMAPGSDSYTMAKYGYIKKTVLDSVEATPLPYVDENDVLHQDIFGGVLIRKDSDTTVSGDPMLMKYLGKKPVVKRIYEYIDDKVWVRFVQPAGKNEVIQETVDYGSWANRNRYQRVDTPFSLYKNTGDPNSIEGLGEVNKTKDLNLELNELGNGDKDTIRYHQYPILIGKGIGLPKDFARTKNAFIEIDPGTEMAYLTWNGTLEESERRQDSLRRAMSQTTGVSLITRGFLKEIGQIRSGPPLKALFTSDRLMMSRKFSMFKANEEKEMAGDVRFWEVAAGADLNIDKTVTFHAEFDTDFLGIDELLNEEINAIKLGSGVATEEEVLEQEHPDWTEEQVQAEAQKIRSNKSNKSMGPLQKSTDKSELEQE